MKVELEVTHPSQLEDLPRKVSIMRDFNKIGEAIVYFNDYEKVEASLYIFDGFLKRKSFKHRLQFDMKLFHHKIISHIAVSIKDLDY